MTESTIATTLPADIPFGCGGVLWVTEPTEAGEYAAADQFWPWGTDPVGIPGAVGVPAGGAAAPNVGRSGATG